MFQFIDFSSFPKINADRETRTPTPVKAYEPESYVSANSTISAKSKMNLKHHRQRQKQRTKIIIYLREKIFKYRKMPNCRSRLSVLGTFQCFPTTLKNIFSFQKDDRLIILIKGSKEETGYPIPWFNYIDKPSKT